MKITADSSAKPPIRSSVEPIPPSPEKNTDSRMIAPKSAMEPAATTSWPKVDEISPASLSTGMITPSEVADRMIATSKGVSINPAAFRPSDTAIAIPNETTNPMAGSRRVWPCSFSNSISRPARKSRKASPITAMTSTASSTSTMPRSAGPITIPATISSTTDGRRTLGKSPSRNGEANAAATTSSRSVNSGIRVSSRRAPRRYGCPTL